MNGTGIIHAPSPENRNRVRTNRSDSPEHRNTARSGEPSLHGPVACQNGDYHRSSGRQQLASALGVTRQLVGDARVAMRGMNLEIADIASAPLPSVDIRKALTDRNAPHDPSSPLGNSHPPALAFEPIQREEIGSAIDAQADVSHHGTRSGERDQLLVVGGSRVANREVLR